MFLSTSIPGWLQTSGWSSRCDGLLLMDSKFRSPGKTERCDRRRKTDCMWYAEISFVADIAVARTCRFALYISLYSIKSDIETLNQGRPKLVGSS